jgi:hypothetical protein
MKKTITIILAAFCIAVLGWQFTGNRQVAEHIEVPPEFIDLVDNTLINPLESFKEGTVILAFHDSELGVDDKRLREFKATNATDSKQFVKIDVNVQNSLARKFHVQNTPEYFVMKNGRVVYREASPSADQGPRGYKSSTWTSSGSNSREHGHARESSTSRSIRQ